MRVAWLFEYPTLHGGERSLLATLPVLRKAKIEPVALAPPQGLLAEELARHRIRLVPFNIVDGGHRLPRDALREELAARLRELRPTLLHANSLSMGRLSGPVTQTTGLPSIAHLRDIIGLSAAAIADLNCHTRLLAVSHATRDFHALQGIDGDRTCVCYNGVDLELFRPRPPTGRLHRRLGLSNDVMLVGTIGQIIMRKGHDVLIRAAGRVKDRLPQLHWLIVGERHSQKAEAIDYQTGLHAAIETAGLRNRFHFLGTLDNVAEVLPELMLVVHPARQEPLGRVLLEAAASAVPCIATEVGGTREIFPEASMARLIPPNDDAALAAALDDLVSSPIERSQMAQAARRRAEEQLDIDQAARSLVEHYRAVTAMRSPAASGQAAPSSTRAS
jgi:glycosyltransferase involved in cell wall biosynthesis